MTKVMSDSTDSNLGSLDCGFTLLDNTLPLRLELSRTKWGRVFLFMYYLLIYGHDHYTLAPDMI